MYQLKTSLFYPKCICHYSEPHGKMTYVGKRSPEKKSFSKSLDSLGDRASVPLAEIVKGSLSFLSERTECPALWGKLCIFQSPL